MSATPGSTVKLNLARRSFVNSRPVTRLAVALWLLSAVGLAANVWLYQSYYQGSGARARRLAEIEQELTRERNAIAGRQAELAGLGLARQNATVDFFNQKIAERTFSWSRLFDRFAEVMPGRVRLTSLGQDSTAERKASQAAAPAQGRPTQGSSEEKPPETPQEKVVRLQMSGQAESDEDLLAFVDAVFEHPSFRDPNLLRESQRDGEHLAFDLAVDYLPAGLAAPAASGGGSP